MLRVIKISLIFLLISLHGYAQTYREQGVKIGLLYEIGQPIHRLGATLGFHINYGNMQFIGGATYFYAWRNYGPSISRWELQSNAHISLGFGNEFNPQEDIANLSAVSNLGNRENRIGYGIKYYLDGIKTSQRTGIITMLHNNLFIAAENDGFAFLPWDQYRTGAFSVGMNMTNNSIFGFNQHHRVSVDVILYTGKTQGTPTEKINDSNYPSRFGYKKLNDAQYHQTSHGILKCSWQSSLAYGQNAFASVGIDNEKIRNTIQNKFIHDMPFLPSRLIKIKNPHVPMRDSLGKDYLYQKNQTMRKGKLVWGVGFNRPLFY